MSSSPVAETVTTAASAAEVSSMVAWVSVTVMATFEIVIVMSSLSSLTSSVAWTVSV